MRHLVHRPVWTGQSIGQELPVRSWPTNASLAATPPAIVFLIDPHSRIDEDLLMRVYGLTPAETRLATQVASGGTLDSIAERLGVTVNTFRTTSATRTPSLS